MGLPGVEKERARFQWPKGDSTRDTIDEEEK